MGAVKSQLVINDGMTSALRRINKAMGLMLSNFEAVQRASGNSINTANLAAARQEIGRANAQLDTMEENYRNINNQQNNLNRGLGTGSSNAEKLLGKIKNIAATYIGMQGLSKLTGLSDTMTSQRSRLALIVDDGGSVAELEKKIYASAQNSRAYYVDTMATVAKLGLVAGKAFTSNDEIIKFQELVNKNFVVGGASATEQAAAMYQLTQAMGSGRLQGDEYRSIIENAPLLAKSIEDYMRNVQGATGTMKDWASEGKLTADVIKAAVFNSADEVEERFNQMPKTWSQVWTSMKNRAVVALDPVLQKINELANDTQVQSTVSGLISGFAVLANVLLGIFNLFSVIYNFVASNWGWIGPIVWGLVAAFAAYNAVLLVHNTIQGISSAIKTVAAIAAVAHGTATVAEAAATTGMTSAQVAFNAALYACPLTWIILLIIAIIVIVFIVIQVASCALMPETGAIVTTTTAFRGDLQESISTSGTVSGEEQKVLFAPVNGKLAEVYVAAGDAVNAGDVLISYDMKEAEDRLRQATLQQTKSTATYQSAMANNNESRAKLNEANHNLGVLEEQIKNQKAYLTDLQNEMNDSIRGTNNALANTLYELNAESADLQKQISALDKSAADCKFSLITKGTACILC